MRLIKPFRGLRPTPELAALVASYPYDVLSREEAKEIAKNNPHSFLHINKPEIDVGDNVAAFDRSVYQKGKDNLHRFINDGILKRDCKEQFYIYKQVMGSHSQVGLVCIASLDAYENNLIKKHEFTRPDKENDRVNHMDMLGAQVGPVFLTYKSKSNIDELLDRGMNLTPEYDFSADDGTRHIFWVIDDQEISEKIQSAFGDVECLYVADGHHRSAAASRVKGLYKERNPSHSGAESYNYFLAVLFPHDQMQILDYNRIIKDLNGLTEKELISTLEDNFEVTSATSREQAKPKKCHEFALYVNATWYKLTAGAKLINSIDKNDPVKSLDVSILQNHILTPMLNIKDQRTDKRIDFVGGIRGLVELERRVDTGDWDAAIALYATSIESLMAIADANEVMPPKSTWFEPKLRSGLVVHMLD